MVFSLANDFSNWIKGRISKFKFVEGVDFLSISRSPELASGNRGAAIDYHLTLDMAKELSMVENNPKGREARRYFIACEKQALDQQPSIPCELPSPYISPAQKQHLSELVDLVVESGRQKTHGETWKRFHRKMNVNKYELLPVDQFDATVAYLQGKLDDQSIATLIQKHCPDAVKALPAPAQAELNLQSFESIPIQILKALEAANAVAAQVQYAVFKAIMAGENWKHLRWLISFVTDSRHGAPAMVDRIEPDEMITSFNKLTKDIADPGLMVSNVQLASLTSAFSNRLAQRMLASA